MTSASSPRKHKEGSSVQNFPNTRAPLCTALWYF